jgi:hypothetical protein
MSGAGRHWRRGTSRLGTQMNADNASTDEESVSKVAGAAAGGLFPASRICRIPRTRRRWGAAVAEWQRFRDLLPQDCLGYYEAGRLLNINNGMPRPRPCSGLPWPFVRAARMVASSSAALALQKKYPEALACYSTALKQDSAEPADTAAPRQSAGPSGPSRRGHGKLSRGHPTEPGGRVVAQ